MAVSGGLFFFFIASRLALSDAPSGRKRQGKGPWARCRFHCSGISMKLQLSGVTELLRLRFQGLREEKSKEQG